MSLQDSPLRKSGYEVEDAIYNTPNLLFFSSVAKGLARCKGEDCGLEEIYQRKAYDPHFSIDSTDENIQIYKKCSSKVFY